MSALSEQMAQVKIDAAKKVAQAKSELEQKAVDYANQIAELQAKAMETIVRERKDLEAKIAQTIAKVKAESAEELAKLELDRDEKIKEYMRPLFEQYYTMSFDNYPVEMERVEGADIRECG